MVKRRSTVSWTWEGTENSRWNSKEYTEIWGINALVHFLFQGSGLLSILHVTKLLKLSNLNMWI